MNIILYNNYLKCLSFVSRLGGEITERSIEVQDLIPKILYFTIDPISIIPGRKDLWNLKVKC